MKINGNAIRPGMVIEHQGRLWRAVKIQHTQPGKGGAYLQVELKDLRSGSKLNERFRSSVSVERASLDQREYQYLYAEGDMYTFMENETYEQITLSEDALGEDQIPYLQESMIVTVESHEGDPISVRLPELENGIKTLVPPFIETGTRVVINTADGSYVERAKD